MQRQFEEIKQLSYPNLETKVLKWWEEQETFDKSVSTREDGLPFTFYEGPPTANGKPGIHHVMARTLKDLFCRYRTLKGYKVIRKGGWDTHGLPVEIEVEKELNLQSRADIEAYGIKAYNEKCRENVLKYKELWDTLTQRMGYWVDLDDPYITFKNEYIESVWWALKQLHEKGYLYKGHKIAWYSPGSGTVLSSHEVSLGYKDVQDPSITVVFPLKDEPNRAFLAWTTTPWTVVSNMALAVHPDLEYVEVSIQDDDRSYILAKECVSRNFSEEQAPSIQKQWKGKELLGMSYDPPTSYAKDYFDNHWHADNGHDQHGNADNGHDYDISQAWKVHPADYVTTDDGTGIVHTAPAFGADDFETCQKAGIPLFNPVSRDGTFTEQAGSLEGVWFKDADKVISKELKASGHLFQQEVLEHSYPFDWRKGTPLMSFPIDSWFIKTTAIKDRMVEANKTIQWKPESTGTGRFGTWLENNVDWAISRQRYWGTPIPIWVSEQDPSMIEVIGSMEELRAKAGLDEDIEIDLHRPFIDQVTWVNEQGHIMRRIPDLLDVWFDSGAMPFAQWHYPFENEERFKSGFPADFIAEGVDQTRGWFYTLHALGMLLFDEPAYKTVISNGLVLDPKGEKMSKSKGNTVDPFEMIDKYGADTVRWYMMSNSAPWDNLKFSEKGLEETQRKVFNTVTNVYSFFALYANIDEFEYEGAPVAKQDRAEIDRWILSRLNRTIQEVDDQLDSYDATRAARSMERFIDDLSNWYVRRSRRRFWKEGQSVDKASAYQTLYESLSALSKMMASIAPFFAEWLHHQLNDVTQKEGESVHLAYFPSVEVTSLDDALERRMELARSISSMVLRVRNKTELNVRQPLQRILLPANEQIKQDLAGVESIILDEVNVKEIETVDDDQEIVHKAAKPNFPVLGKKVGGAMKAVAQKIQGWSSEEVHDFEQKGGATIELEDGSSVELESDDVEIIRTGLDGWSVESEQGLTIAVDVALTEALIHEGLAREFVNRVQNMRKEASYDVTDRIEISYLSDSPEILGAMTQFSDTIQSETLAESLTSSALDEADFTKTWDFDGRECTIAILRKGN